MKCLRFKPRVHDDLEKRQDLSRKKAVVFGSAVGGSGIAALLARSGDDEAALDESFIRDRTMIWCFRSAEPGMRGIGEERGADSAPRLLGILE